MGGTGSADPTQWTPSEWSIIMTASGDLVHYRGYIADNDRWRRFTFRSDDVIISTPSKSGTTWTQTLVALLLFDGVPDEPVNRLSPWLDITLTSEEEMFAHLEAQEHRRFIKTHTPLDGLPEHPGVTYVTVGRDPRDAYASMRKHSANIDEEVLHARRVAAVGDEDLADLPQVWPEADDLRAHVATFLDHPWYPSSGDVNLANALHHLRLAWDARDDAPHLLLHYADLKTDLAAGMRRLRDVLGLTIPDERVTELAELATIDAMRARAGTAAPEAGTWKDDAAFFRSGRHGDGAALMTDEELRHYDERCQELHGDDPDFLAWVHHGNG